ncbi:MAG: ABC transporter permease [Verrucomicrobia bacterium]|nr:ABC transporter permease [Verrucomicrobiota bacterium]
MEPPVATTKGDGPPINGALLLRAGSLMGFVLVIAYFALVAPGFLSVGNITNVLEQSAILGVLSFGMTIVMIAGGSNVITGGIDLSIANNLGLSAAVYAILLKTGQPDIVALSLTLLTGLAVGLLNAIAVVSIGILPLIATLTVMNICAGFELVITQNTVLQASSPLLAVLAGDGPFGIATLAYLLLIIGLILIAVIEYTPFGLRLYAVGGFREAALAAGLSVNRYIATSYILSGICASIGAVLSVALLSGSSTGSGDMLLSVVVTALLGVVFSRRLVPTISGSLLSVLFIGFLINGFQLTNISSYWVNGVEGLLILFAVATTSLVRRREA